MNNKISTNTINNKNIFFVDIIPVKSIHHFMKRFVLYGKCLKKGGKIKIDV